MFAAGKTATVSGGAPDDKFNYVTMLLHGDGTNGAQNNTFLDSSTNNFTITRNGNTTQGSFSPYGDNWSNYFGGTGNYLTTATSASGFSFGTGDFTIEFWINSTQTTRCDPIGQNNTFSSSGWWGLIGNLSSSGQLQWFENANSRISATATNWNNGSWNHIAVTRSGNSVRMFVNGTQVGSTYTTSFTYGASSVGVIAGVLSDDKTTGPLTGYLSNFRIVKGTALYTGTFTPSTAPLTAVSGTSLLTCQANRFFDASTNALAITTTGSPSVQRFSPFSPTAAYSTSVIGGSGYFDGNDYLNTPSTGQFTASGDFTVSCWFYLQSFANSYYVVGGNWDGGTSDEWLIQIQNNGAIRFLTSAGTSFSSSGVVKLNEWTYFTATRSGTTVTVQLNGTTVSTYTKSDTLGASSKTIYIGQQSGNNWPFNGYITDFRLLSGSAITTVPTAPVSSTSTGLLLSMTNGAIFDNAMMNDLETVGNAQISTSVKKYGTGSLAFDGSGDYLFEPATNLLAWGTGDFTIEMWINTSTTTISGGASRTMWGTSSASYQGQLYLEISTGKVVFGNTGSTFIKGTSNVADGNWNHIAISRSGTTCRLFVNGTQEASGTNSVNYDAQATYIGAFGASDGFFNGYIDDIRITKGYARYTSNFTAPTAAFSDKGPY